MIENINLLHTVHNSNEMQTTTQLCSNHDWGVLCRHGSPHFVSEPMTAGPEGDPTAAVSQRTTLRFPALLYPTVWISKEWGHILIKNDSSSKTLIQKHLLKVGLLLTAQTWLCILTQSRVNNTKMLSQLFRNLPVIHSIYNLFPTDSLCKH